ncbi:MULTISPECIES: phosphoenolpyruvate carboxylase [Salinibaculum]|uniref:phosphoenolpyruvate carboxylase n=1 Tax=Salinibaculum TaxID=2732368 RepID=UPI0030D4119E
MERSSLHNRTLEQDIGALGDILEAVITEQADAADFELVEEIREAAAEYREGDHDSREPISRALTSVDADTQSTVARAFTTYFILTNLAEERERVRAVRRGQDQGTFADSIEAAVQRLVADGADPEEVERVLEDVSIQPTFTAHPTEARRKTVKAKLRRSAGSLRSLDERRLTEKEQEDLLTELKSEVETLWQTALIRDRRPEVTDEALNVQWYLENVLYDRIGETYSELDRVLSENYDADIDVSQLYEFRSWAGSDRDGNPYVTPEVTEETLDRQRSVALSLYRDDLSDLVGTLSAEQSQITVEDHLAEQFELRKARLPAVASEVETRYEGEPYRQFLELVRAGLARVAGVLPGGYRDEDEFVADVAALEESLRANNAAEVADTHVTPLRRKAETFGFTLAGLDLRDHRQKHTTALEDALSAVGVDYAGMDEAERVDFLTEAVLQDEPVIDLTDTADLGETAQRVLTRFDHLADWQREYGVSAIDTYCISMCEEPSHVLEVLFLADQAEVVDLPTHCGLDIVPLLETEYALSGAKRIMGTLFENEAYAAALAAREDVQEIMLGYSDSNKENGFLAANWSLHVNQKRLADITEAHDVELRLFHGRGGSISRGGGPMSDALLALPPETVTGQVKFTEQGEAISEKYANPRIAERSLEQMLNAQMRARYNALSDPGEDVPERWTAAMETAADAARDAYRDLLDSDGFVEYFEEATPIRVIEDLNLGSRPASRTGERTVEDLRSIPWVFSWTQARCILPGWYSLAAGFQAYLDEGGDIETLQEMYEEWPFFATTLDNASLALARTDLEIAAGYADLATEDLQEQFFPRIESEYEAACDLLRRITGRDHLLERAWLRESLSRRNPHVDPLNVLQMQLLRDDDRSELEQSTLRMTVKGIAAGMQNTG